MDKLNKIKVENVNNIIKMFKILLFGSGIFNKMIKKRLNYSGLKSKWELR